MPHESEIQYKDILASEGLKFVNRSYYRSFSLNIFIGNSRSLFLMFQRETDSENYLKTPGKVQEDHAFRELNRIFHNFLTGSSTLVDHTRVFVDEFYKGTVVERNFRTRVESSFSKNSLTRFIQDLRNYMSHRGLPHVHKETNFSQSKENPGSLDFKITLYLDVPKLMEWSGWKAESKKFLQASGKRIDLPNLAKDYHEQILQFHQELDKTLAEYHKDDISKLVEMQKTFLDGLPINQDGGKPDGLPMDLLQERPLGPSDKPIYLTLFLLPELNALTNKAAASTREEAIEHAESLVLAFDFQDSDYLYFLVNQIRAWDGTSIATFLLPNGCLIQSPIYLKSWDNIQNA